MPLVTVPSRPFLRFAPVLVIAALMAFYPTLMRANTIAENTGGDQFSYGGFYWGQSFTTVTLSPVSNIAVNLFSDVPSTTPYALGTGFLLSMAYTGTPSSLSSATPGFVDQATASGGFYTFNSSLTLLPNTQYFFYENAPLDPMPGGNHYAGGHYYYSSGGDFFAENLNKLPGYKLASRSPRHRNDSFSARIRFARPSGAAAQIALLRHRAGSCLRGEDSPS